MLSPNIMTAEDPVEFNSIGISHAHLPEHIAEQASSSLVAQGLRSSAGAVLRIGCGCTSATPMTALAIAESVHFESPWMKRHRNADGSKSSTSSSAFSCC